MSSSKPGLVFFMEDDPRNSLIHCRKVWDAVFIVFEKHEVSKKLKI